MKLRDDVSEHPRLKVTPTPSHFESKEPIKKPDDSPAAKQVRFVEDKEWAYESTMKHKGKGLLLLGEKRFILSRFVG